MFDSRFRTVVQYGLHNSISVRRGYLDLSHGGILRSPEAIEAATKCADERRVKLGSEGSTGRCKGSKEDRSRRRAPEKMEGKAQKQREKEERTAADALAVLYSSAESCESQGAKRRDSSLEQFIAKEHSIGWASEVERFFNGTDPDICD